MLKKGLLFAIYGGGLLLTIVTLSTNVRAVSSSLPSKTHQEELRKELSINMPTRTNDPSYSITFVPPDPKAETSVQVDDKVFKNVKPPFVLPSLSVGEHSITFKYRSKKGALKILVETILITPKPPIFDADIPVEGNVDQKMNLHGISIPSGTINILHNSQTVITTQADDTGKWEVESTPLILGRNTFIAQVDKNGFISNFSKSISMNVGTQSLIIDSLINKNESPKKNLTDYWQDLVNWIQKNQDQAVILGGALGAIIVTLTIYRLFIGTKRRKRDRTIRDILNNTRSNEQNFATKLSKNLKKNLKKVKSKKETKSAPLVKIKAKTSVKKMLKKKQISKKIKTKQKVVQKTTKLSENKVKRSIIFKKERLLKTESTKTEANATKSLTKEEFLKKFKQS